MCFFCVYKYEFDVVGIVVSDFFYLVLVVVIDWIGVVIKLEY